MKLKIVYIFYKNKKEKLVFGLLKLSSLFKKKQAQVPVQKKFRALRNTQKRISKEKK